MAVTWSLSDIVYPATNDDKSDIMDGLHTLITALTHWQVENDDRANGVIVVSPTGGDATDQRIIFAIKDNNAWTGSSLGDPYSGLTSGSENLRRIWAGYSHDSSGGAGYVAGTFDNDDPLNLPDTDKWWKYYAMTADWNDGWEIDKIWAIESENTLVILCAKADGSKYGGGMFGYCFRDAENNLKPAVFTRGPKEDVSIGMTTDFLSESASHFMTGGTNEANPASVGWTGTEVCRLNPLHLGPTQIPHLTSRAGTRVHLPLYYQEASSYYYGRLEQIRHGQDGTERMRITDNNGVVKSFSFSPSLSATSDALTFDQE